MKQANRSGSYPTAKRSGTGYRLVETMKTVLIFVLIVIMLVLLILLMLGQSTTWEGTRMPTDRMVVYTTGVQTGYTKEMDASRTVPETLLLRSAGGDVRCLLADTSMGKAYASLYEPVRTLLGSGAVCTLLDRVAGDLLWESGLASDNWIAITYRGALPPAVIRAYTFAEEESEEDTAFPDETPAGDVAYIRHLLLLSSEVLSGSSDAAAVGMHTFCAVTRDDDGNTAIFRLASAETGTQEDVAAAAAILEPGVDAGNGNPIDRYIRALSNLTANTKPVAFTDPGQIPVLLPENNNIYRLPCLTLSEWNPITALFYGDTGDQANAILSLLGMEEQDTDNYYTDTSGNRVYLNADGRLRLSHDGNIRYTASGGGGIPIAEYLGYASVGGGYLLSEYLRACDRLLAQLAEFDPALGGGDAEICLFTVHTAAEAEEGAGGLVLRYVYACGSVPLLDGTGQPMYALSVTCSDGFVKAMDWDVRYVTYQRADTTGEYLLPQSVIRDAIALEHPGAVDGGLRLAYIPVSGQPELLRAAWIMGMGRKNR